MFGHATGIMLHQKRHILFAKVDGYRYMDDVTLLSLSRLYLQDKPLISMNARDLSPQHGYQWKKDTFSLNPLINRLNFEVCKPLLTLSFPSFFAIVTISSCMVVSVCRVDIQAHTITAKHEAAWFFGLDDETVY